MENSNDIIKKNTNPTQCTNTNSMDTTILEDIQDIINDQYSGEYGQTPNELYF